MATIWSTRTKPTTTYGTKKVDLFYLFSVLWEQVTDNDWNPIMIFWESGSWIPYNNTDWWVRTKPVTVYTTRIIP